MAGRKRPKVVLCATLTADGKLDASVPIIPPVLSGGSADPARHPWGAGYDEAAGVLLDLEEMRKLKASGEGMKPVVALNWPLIETWPPEKRRAQLLDALRKLRGEFPRAVLCFGGAGLFRGVLEAGLADELWLCVCPRVDGRRGGPTLSGMGGAFFPASVACRLVRMEVAGDECFLRYRVVRRARVERKAD